MIKSPATSLAVGAAAALSLLGLVGVALAAGSRPGVAAARSQDTAVEPAHFHHVHLNVTDVDSTMAWYEKFFGANRIRYRDRSNALFTERSFILMNRVAQAPRDNFGTSLWHIGWAGVDGHSEFEWREREGIGVQTPITPLGTNFYMYFWGPSKELVEVYTGSKNHRFEHVHLIPTDIEATIGWFREHFGVEPNGPTRAFRESRMRVNTIRIDNVNLIMFEAPGPGVERNPILPDSVGPHFAPTDGRAMDHIAFSYADLEPVYERFVDSGVEIVKPIQTSEEFGLKSFFVRGPDGLLVEIVEEDPIPEGIWR